jgi:hypothetical protein
MMNSLGDLNGDNSDDFVLPGTSAGWKKLNVYFGGASLDTVRDAWFGLDSVYGIGLTAVGTDINSNGKPEIVSWANDCASALFYEWSLPPDSAHILQLTPANLQLAVDYDNFGNCAASGNFGGDVSPDIAVGLVRHWSSGVSGAVYVYWGGAAFDTIPDLIISRPGGYVDGAESFGGNILEQVGDLNNDGFDDLFASSSRSGDDSLGFVFFGGPELDTIPEVTIAQPHNVARAAGDLNLDGYGDLILGYGVDLSSVGAVYVYYGGQPMDSIPDIVFTNAATPGFQINFGLDVSGVGDFNNDGLNDFAFSLKESGGVELVLIYSGTDIDSVDYDYEPSLPSDYTLSHNYPNPFNSETRIQFTLPARTRVTLSVYNMLGAEVTRLTEGTLSAGSYTVVWDGTDSGGRPVASGVYLYRLSAGRVSLTRKMILLK